MELGFLIILGGLFLIFVFIASCAVSLRRASSEDLAQEYLAAGLGALKARIEEKLRFIEGRETELKEKLEHLEALEKAVSERSAGCSESYELARRDWKDAV